MDLGGEVTLDMKGGALFSGSATSVACVIGDVRDRPCLIIDDMISTGGTITKSIEVLLKHGARRPLTVAATHGVFTEAARKNLSHTTLGHIFVTPSGTFL